MNKKVPEPCHGKITPMRFQLFSLEVNMNSLILRANNILLPIIALLVMAMTAPAAFAAPSNDRSSMPVRFSTFNASLNRFNAGDLVAELSAPGSSQ